MLGLGVNIDHVATLRQVRGVSYPDVLQAARVALAGGADLITVHLREDRRHIQDQDVADLLGVLPCRLNLELAASAPMLDIAQRLRPADVCLVPERRAELTTEGGLDLLGNMETLRVAVRALTQAGIRVALFVDPDPEALRRAADLGAPAVELHTGRYALATGAAQAAELARLHQGVVLGTQLGLIVNAGHGLTLQNVGPVATLPGLKELNIGHAIVARAVFVGLGAAVAEMRAAMDAGVAAR